MAYNLQFEYRLSDSEMQLVNLLKNKQMTMKELVDLTGFSQSSVYNHFNTMGKKGIIVEKWSKKGKELFYFIENPLGLREEFQFDGEKGDTVNNDLYEAISNTSQVIQRYDMNPRETNGHVFNMPNETCAIVWAADFHIGHTHANYPLIKHIFTKVREIPNLYIALLGDLIDNSANLGSPRGTENLINKSGQLRMVESLLFKLDDKIVILIEGNHENRSYISDHFRVNEFIAKEHQCKYGGYGEPFSIVHGKKVYKVFCRHDARGRSQYNPLHANIRSILFEFSRKAHDADIVVTAHKHQSASAVYDVGGKERTLIAVGNTVNRDDFAERIGLVSGIDDYPVTLFHPSGYTVTYRHFNHGVSELIRYG